MNNEKNQNNDQKNKKNDGARKTAIPIQFQAVNLETKAKLPKSTLVREDNDDLQLSKPPRLKKDGYIEAQKKKNALRQKEKDIKLAEALRKNLQKRKKQKKQRDQDKK